MKKKTFCYEYPRPAVTVDVVIASGEKPARVLLIRRKHDPFAGMWAIPGGFVDMDEGLEDAARRELREETGIDPGSLEQMAAFGDPGRDPRGRTISVVYLAIVDPKQVRPRAGDDAGEVAWHLFDQLPPLAFDHDQILAMAQQRLRPGSRTAGYRDRKRKSSPGSPLE